MGICGELVGHDLAWMIAEVGNDPERGEAGGRTSLGLPDHRRS